MGVTHISGESHACYRCGDAMQTWNAWTMKGLQTDEIDPPLCLAGYIVHHSLEHDIL